MSIDNNSYRIDFTRLVEWLVPPELRQEKEINWLLALVKPVSGVLYNTLRQFRKNKLYELGITPQVCYLEKLLNDRYDFTLRRIRIVDAVDHSPVVFYQEDELKPVVFYQESEDLPVVFYTEGEAGEIKDDFVVLVPISIVFIMNEMIELIKLFKYPATIFTIQRV